MKRIILAILAVWSAYSVTAYATTVEFTIGSKNITIHNETVVQQELDAAPFINENNRTMVPVRAISDAFNADIDWNDQTREVLITKDNTKIKLIIDNTTAYSNDTALILDSAPVIVNDRTFVPLRFISEAFLYNVNYAAATSQIIIDDTDIILSCGNKNMTFAEFESLYELLHQLNYEAAKASQISDEEFKQYIIESALELAYSMNKFSNTFSDLSYSTEDLEAIRTFILENDAIVSIPLSGLNSLVHEKYYLSTGEPILKNILATQDINSIYTNEYVCAKHILVENKETADEVLKKIENGEAFDALISEYGQDPGMSANPDGYTFTKGEMVVEFETASFELKPEEISKPIQTTYGYHIIKREELPALSEETKTRIAESIAIQKLQNTPDPEILIDTETLSNML